MCSQGLYAHRDLFLFQDFKAQAFVFVLRFCFFEFLKFYLLIFIGVWLVYNVLLLLCSKVNQLCIYIYIYIHRSPPFFRVCPHIDHYTVLSRVPCANEQVLISYLSQRCVNVNPVSQFLPPPFLFVTISFVFYICDSITVF